jgi:hypothetical protein
MATTGTRIHLREDEESWKVDQSAKPDNMIYTTRILRYDITSRIAHMAHGKLVWLP